MKKKEQETGWIARLRSLMEANDFNPRSLSLKAGLNPTAVRDMLEGRVKYPRYDTVESLAKALNITPARLMSGETAGIKPQKTSGGAASLDDEDLNLLTEIIARLQETAEEYRHALKPKDFAAMVTTIYRQVKPDQKQAKKDSASLQPRIKDLMDYERLRKRTAGK